MQVVKMWCKNPLMRSKHLQVLLLLKIIELRWCVFLNVMFDVKPHYFMGIFLYNLFVAEVFSLCKIKNKELAIIR